MPNAEVWSEYAAIVVLAVACASIALFILVFLRRNWRSDSLGQDCDEEMHADEEVAAIPALDTTPDRPEFFGYKIAWIVVRTDDGEEVARFYKSAELRPANWASGVEAARQGLAFVSPPVDGWTFIVMPEGGIDADEDIMVVTENLSRRFHEAQYFHTYRGVGAHAWYLFRDGKEIRGYECGEDGDIDRGAPTVGEVELGYRNFGAESPEGQTDETCERIGWTSPDEDDVMEVAGKWSIDPRILADREELGCGWVIVHRSSSEEWRLAAEDGLGEQ